jgi:hypothetical protein
MLIPHATVGSALLPPLSFGDSYNAVDLCDSHASLR